MANVGITRVGSTLDSGARLAAANHVIIVIALFWVVIVAPFAWMLRDGLGPDAHDSSGAAALCAFVVTFVRIPLAWPAWALFAVAAMLSLVARSQKSRVAVARRCANELH